MENLKRQLTFKDGISLAFGSILGSGILFLPSLTYFISGKDTIWVWLFTTLLCIPLVYIFSDMVKEIPNESGIEGFVSAGLGSRIGSTIPILFLGTVSLGMPSSALIVGEYVKNCFSGGTLFQLATAIFIVVSGMFVNLSGIKIGANIQLAITFLIAIVSVALLILAPPTMAIQTSLNFSSIDIVSIMPGIVVAFWAFAGFENLTFMAGEFKNPARDLKISMFVSLFCCGLLYLLLSLSCQSNITQANVNPIAGLYQLSETVFHPAIATLVITIFAFLAVQINFNSWIWGISRLIYSCAKQKKLPVYFSALDNKNIPTRAIYTLGLIFIGVILISTLFPSFLETMLVVVSTNFVFIYALCLTSYVLYRRSGVLKIIAAVMLALFAILMLSSKWLVLYPIFLFGLGLFINKIFYSGINEPKIQENSKREITKSADLIFIDDYESITQAWVMHGATVGKTIATYNSIHAFRADINKFDLSTPVYVDSDLNDEMKGQDFAKELYEYGFKNIYLSTGYPPSKFPKMFWIKEVVGKMPPF